MISSMSRYSFKVVLRSGEDGWVVAECPALVGCVSQGRTRDEALANVREAIELCLDAGDEPGTGEVEVAVVEVDAA